MKTAARKLPTFDPRSVPVIRVDAHLPLVAADTLVPQALRQRFIRPPDWTPELRAEHLFTDRAPARASVLIPIVMREQPMVLLTQRASHLASHSGQIAFPGGKVDAEDADTIATALRETFEEVGLESASIEVLGTMPDYLTGSAFIVTPVVALVVPEARIAANPQEVEHVFEVPLAFLMNPAHHRCHRFDWEGTPRYWYSMPYAEAGREWFIWGATAGMLRNFYRFLSA